MKGDGGLPFNGRKDRDEDLLLFKELHKREKDRLASLLQPVSDEFEPNVINGNYALYRIASGKKGSGYEFFGENDKSDYDWLKTPPATPLFPSLEMEANGPQLVLQREIPIAQPLSRFSASNSEALKGTSAAPKSPNSKPKIPVRSVTPAAGQRSTQTLGKNAKVVNQKMAQLTADLNKRTNMITNTNQTNFPSKNITASDSKTRPTSRGGGGVRSTIPAGFSNDTPPNLRIDRATSATRGRPVVVSNPTVISSVHQKTEPTLRSKRQSCSPSVTRGRKQNEENLTNQKPKVQTGTQIFGSRIVDKVMNVRKLSAEEREAKQKPQGTNYSTANTYGGFGRMVSSKSSLDMALKQMEIKRDGINPRHIGFVPGRMSTRD